MIRTSKGDASARILSGDYALIVNSILVSRADSPASELAIAVFTEIPDSYYIAKIDVSDTPLNHEVSFSDKQMEVLGLRVGSMLEEEESQNDVTVNQEQTRSFDDMFASTSREDAQVETVIRDAEFVRTRRMNDPMPAPVTPHDNIKSKKPHMFSIKHPFVKSKEPEKQTTSKVYRTDPADCTRTLRPSGEPKCKASPIAIGFMVRLDKPEGLTVELACRDCVNYIKSKRVIHVIGWYYIRHDETPANKMDVKRWIELHQTEIMGRLAGDLPVIIDNIHETLRQRLGRNNNLPVGSLMDFINSAKAGLVSILQSCF